ncbi:phage/plasmid primase, P4 family [Bradyrhizobium sp. AZCC 2289]|uniref:phage/plasmid primase, P4 family n=1 Tax=Bradyrhizobium sp. AZCC 2289 TaxID=3117026 RepID=UPI002FEFBDAA
MTITANTTTAETLNIPLHYARLYLAAGYCPIPVKSRDKEPVDKAWQKLRLTEPELPCRFRRDHNVSVLLGEPSSGIVDIDLDDPDAVKLAPYFLPETEFVFGRASKPRSHFVYQVPSPGNIRKCAAGKKNIIEVRATGGHTVFPGSVHRDTGEIIEFSHPIGDELSVPAQTTREILDVAATKIAIGSVLLDQWPKGIRHDLSLATAGLLAKNGWAEDEVVQFIEAICAVANDDEVSDRIRAVRDTFERYRNGETVRGWTALVECIGRDAAGHIEKFLGGTSGNGDHHPPRGAANSNCQWTKANFASDHDAAMTFAAQCEGNLRFSTGTDQWYHRTVQVFEPVAPAIAQGIVGDFAAMAQQQVGDDAGKIKSRAKINAILELSRAPLAIGQDVIDCDPNLVGLADGRILDLQTGDIVPANQDAFVTKKLGAPYDPTAQCPRWLGFLDTIFEGNQDMIDFVQRAVGYSVSGEVTEQCLFILIGSGANGKSTFINAVRHMLGHYAGATPMQTLTAMPFSNGQTNDLAAMEGKRFISASDGEAGQRLAEAKIKNMTGGDPINCRAMYKEFHDIYPQFKLWVATNDLPKVSGSDDAIWRRIRVIEFRVTIPESERDPHLSSALAAEASGILNWALDGYRSWKANGLKPPIEVTEATGSYRNDNDLVGQFIDDRCVRQPTAKCTSKMLHEGYVQWCSDNGHTPMPINTFAKELKKKGFTSRKAQKGNGWTGIDIKPAFQNSDSDENVFAHRPHS